ncbi:3-phosphoserine/phosphohydroxythreonine transaminase [Paracrocinitomix mangrovi]|uniref:3-phosphoserine/phosphohydroxythreonine transaminase n=1 Tax=Paracrocinitomix mangrovi TaxID=2862509 RepID=UPI001C8E7A53|nr:3-phosphoserine/phosphohydroxythreonine transaminase [Paracrocinitomix mangrovi]UKN02765.1 3-phosphoserine/phosphohydroxythreonine transaminase [Paracrocinitomix mangrovi]
MKTKHNFGAGPCILPQEVFEEASKAVLDFNGLSILEISHRSPEFIDVMEEARSLVKKALNVPDGYTVLFLQGGASLGFLISAMNMSGANKKAAYVNTGAWAKKASKEGKNAGLQVDIIASSEDQNFNYIPKGFDISSDYDFLHITTNNTIFGTQFKSFPETSVPLVADMSSDIFSKQIDVSKFDIIYAGAQKNLGPAGATVFIVKEEILGKSTHQNIPTYLNLLTHHEKDSMFNTPPVFSIYVSMLNLRHLLANGGVAAAEQRNEAKAALLYNEIDSNPLFKGTAVKEDRSNMNVTFVMTDDALTDEFNKMWNDAGLVGLKGHRDVGGFRASMYNAMNIDSVEVLVEVMQEIATKKA